MSVTQEQIDKGIALTREASGVSKRTSAAIERAGMLITDYFYLVKGQHIDRMNAEGADRGRRGNAAWKEVVNRQKGAEVYKLPTIEELEAKKAAKLAEIDAKVKALRKKHRSLKKLKQQADRAYKRWFRPLKKAQDKYGTL